MEKKILSALFVLLFVALTSCNNENDALPVSDGGNEYRCTYRGSLHRPGPISLIGKKTTV